MDQLTGESQIVSRALMAHNPLETPTNLTWDGFYAACEGQRLEDMPTTYHVCGWWQAAEFGECDHAPVVIVNGVDVAGELADLLDAREDEEWQAKGC